MKNIQFAVTLNKSALLNYSGFKFTSVGECRRQLTCFIVLVPWSKEETAPMGVGEQPARTLQEVIQIDPIPRAM